MEEFIKWVRETSLGEWFMVVTSAASVFVAIIALRVSKRSAQATIRTDIRPTRFDFTSSQFVNIHLYNPGPGRAYNITILTPKITDYTFKPDESGNIFTYNSEYVKATAKDLDLEESRQIEVEGVTLFRIDLDQPLILKFQLADGDYKKEYWRHVERRRNRPYDERIAKMTPREIRMHKIKMVLVYTLTPYRYIATRYIKWNHENPRNFAMSKYVRLSYEKIKQEENLK